MYSVELEIFEGILSTRKKKSHLKIFYLLLLQVTHKIKNIDFYQHHSSRTAAESGARRVSAFPAWSQAATGAKGVPENFYSFLSQTAAQSLEISGTCGGRDPFLCLDIYMVSPYLFTGLGSYRCLDRGASIFPP